MNPNHSLDLDNAQLELAFEQAFGTSGLNAPKQQDTQAHKTIQERFEEFHALNPAVYRVLVRLARDLTAKGYTKLAIEMLWQVLRWQILLRTKDPSSEFKLNDHYRGRYARMIMAREPDLAGIFETRQLRAS